jgi:predicted transcriptional regulator
VDEPGELHLGDLRSLRAMAHPLRMRIVGSLRIDGPATSAMLARRLNTDSGQTSHHLRQLARYGFVVDAPDLGKGRQGRERWWRAAQDTTTRSDLEEQGPEGKDAVQVASRSGDYPIRTTPEGLTALLVEVKEVIARHDVRDRDLPGAQTVVVLVHAFPHRAQEIDQP